MDMRHATSISASVETRLADLYWKLEQVNRSIAALERVEELRAGRRRSAAAMIAGGERAERRAARTRGSGYVTLWRKALKAA
jgi:hypothetical protein